MNTYEKERMLAVRAVLAAGEAVMGVYAAQDAHATEKVDGSIVTQADTAADRIIHEVLCESRLPVLSEEATIDPAEHAALWVVDPLDGTMDFVQRTGEFSIMVALVVDGIPVLGVVYLPASARLYSAFRGGGAYCQYGDAEQARIAVSTCVAPEMARMLVSRNHATSLDEHVANVLHIATRVPTGSNGIKLARIAEGEAEVFLNPTNRMGWWDTAAPQCILEEAGGRVTDTRGEELVYRGRDTHVPCGIVATNSLLHTQVLAACATL